MDFMNKLKKVFKNIVGDFAGIQWRDLDHKKVYGAIAAVIAVIVLVVVLIVSVISGENNEQPQDTKEPATVGEEVEESAENSAAVEEAVEEEDSLEVNAYEEINALISKYFNGLSTGDLELVASTVDVLTDEEKLTIERKKDYIEAYNNITCYTKKGLEEGSYVVFTAYEMKIYNIETAAPGIMALYVCTADNGELYIFNGEASEELTNYVLELAAEEEVAAVIADVDARYQQLAAQDEDLGKFAETMLQSQEEATVEPEEPEAPTESNDEEVGELEEPVSTAVTDNIRIREGRSTETRMIGTLAAGTGVKVYANYEDGWSKIEYNGTVGYCKTEFLESTEGVPTVGTASENTEEEPEQTEETTPEETEGTTAEDAAATAVNKKMQLTDAVRIRADRSTESEILTLAYKSEIVTVLENYSDGWSKVDYNGKVGYCKTEFLEEVR